MLGMDMHKERDKNENTLSLLFQNEFNEECDGGAG